MTTHTTHTTHTTELFSRNAGGQSFLLASLLAISYVWAPQARSTIVIHHSLEEMVHKADVVVHARVVDQFVEKDAGRILTYTQIEILDGLKGASKGDILTIYQVGGSYDGITQRIPGTHEHQTHEEMVLFAMKHRDVLVSYGVGIGKFLVERNHDAARVIEDVQDVVVWKKGAHGHHGTEDSVLDHDPSLEDFKKKVTATLTKPRLKRKDRKLWVLPIKGHLLPLQLRRGGE